jgi:hypothetical protein
VWNVVDVIYFWSANQFHSEFCMDMVTIFCDIDDFCQRLWAAPPSLLPSGGQKKRDRSPRLALSEILTILVFFHASHYRTFKHL